jgi:hypothetical protein
LDRTDVDDPAPGRAELFQKGMCHVEHAMEVDRHDVLPVLDHGLGIRGEGIAPVDAGIVDQDRDLAHLRADARSNLAAPVVLGHVEYEAARFAAGSCDGLGGFGRRVAIDVEDSNVCSLLRIAERDRSADARPATSHHRDAVLKTPDSSELFVVHYARRQFSANAAIADSMAASK